MIKYILKRILSLLPVLIGITILSFLIGHFSPSDPAYISLTRDGVTDPTEAEIAQKRHELKLDLPFHEQYMYWLSNTVRGDFGKSMYDDTAIADQIKKRLPITIRLSFYALFLAIVFGILFGVIMTKYRGEWLDSIVGFLTSIFMAVPSFWFGIILITIFAEKLKWLPTSGLQSDFAYVLPAIVLSIGAIGVSARLSSANFLGEISKHYVLTANAKGVPKFDIGTIHIFKNALIPIVTYFGIYFASILGGTSVVERLFAIPGMGSYVIEAIFNRDYYVLQAYVVIMGSIYVLVNIIIDILYFYINPKLANTALDE